MVNRLAHDLLESHFAPTLHQEILDAVGMPWISEPALIARRKCDPEFRLHILHLYTHRCAVCGYDGRLGNNTLGVEAAHIKWHAAGGPDEPNNGIAHCSFHHKMLDKGAMGISTDRLS